MLEAKGQFVGIMTDEFTGEGGKVIRYYKASIIIGENKMPINVKCSDKAYEIYKNTEVGEECEFSFTVNSKSEIKLVG